MRILERLGKVFVVFGAFALATFFALRYGSGGLWRGFEPALAVTGTVQKAPYDLTRLEAVNETLKMIRDKYVDPDRVKPRDMLMSALNYVQRDVAQVIVLNDDPNEVTIRVETAEKKFRVDNIQGPWDVSARLREVFAFLQKNLRGTEVDLREVEYAACNGMLHTLDPHSVFMSPEAYKEMNLSTSGAFGGLGIVISIRDQMLTVLNPMPDTPAGRAGLKRLDRIVKINNESTLNMPLDDAVRRLRGDPGTPVTVWVTREGEAGWQGTKSFQLTREVIKVKSVESKALDNGIGYVRMKTFQQSTAAELEAALDDLKSRGPIKGLVLDLRGNPGGLLEQAARVADKFLFEGTIVSTVGFSEGREEKRAKGPGTEPAYPLVVLVSGNSASASEIVAGALKNNDRALIVGQQTFGKGSVQLVFPEVTPEKAALKLTIAQYLTPGDVSIQGVGVTPDIELSPMTVDDLEMNLVARKDGIRERDLSAHLSNVRAVPAGKPGETVRYNLTSADREAIRDRGGEIDDENFQLDFAMRFGRELASRLAPSTKRLDQLRTARDFIEQTRRDEVAKVSAELSKLGVDWSEAPTDPAQIGAPKDLEIKLETDRPSNEVTAGEPMELKISVTNNGKLPVYRLRGTTDSDNPYFDNKELILGKIAPGQTRTAKTPLGWCEVEGRKAGSTKPKDKNARRSCKVPMDALTRSDGIRVKFDAGGGGDPAPVEIRPTVHALERPMFEYSYQLADNGNGDGRVQKGEQVTMYLSVKNAGKGRSHDTQANISNLSGDGLLLRAGRFDISNMNPGDVRKVAFTFDVNQALSEPEATLSLSVGDRDLREFVTEKVKIPIQAPAQVTRASGAVKAGAQGATLLPSPDAGARGFGRLAPGASAQLVGKVGDLDKIDLGGGRFAFVASREVAAGGSPAGTVAFDDLYLHAPPTLEVKSAAMSTRGDKVKVTGVASDTERLLDVYIFVGSRKLYYKSNRDGADPKRSSIEFDAPLRPGVNLVTVVARETPDTTTRRTLVIRRDGPDGAILKTPKTDDPISDGVTEDSED